MHLSLMSKNENCQQKKFFPQLFALLIPLISDWGKKSL